MIPINDRVLQALAVLKESRQVLRVLEGRERELEAVRNQISHALAEVARLQESVKLAGETFEEVKNMHRSRKGKWKERA